MNHAIACLLIAAGTRCVLADPGDDFANNLFTDLSPLLALFGERVTMQFLSQSIGLADCIMLAMAPLGIITIIVSAIRVGGPLWLKATIGRARENLSKSEIELMSSTSKETSELWDGQNIVRCSGEGAIWQFICLVPKNQNKQSTFAPEVEVRKLGEPEENDPELLKSTEVTAWKRFLKTHEDPEQKEPAWAALWSRSKSTVIDSLKTASAAARGSFRSNVPTRVSVEEGMSPSPETKRSPIAESKNPTPQMIYVVRNLHSAPPNLTLNCHTYFDRYFHYAVVLVGMVLQSLVLAYAGLITYHPYWKHRFLKDGSPLDSYAFPSVAVGTILLAFGIFLCAYIVEASTTELHYEAADAYDAYIVWLQKSNTVGDQKFDPCAIYPVCKRQYVTFSFRIADADLGNTDPTKSRPPSHGKTEERWLALWTMVATVICLVGYLIQFIGLRGMNWSASIAQLVAIALMTTLRALVRRDLDKKPIFNTIVNGYEIDWFAISLMSETAPWRMSRDKERSRSTNTPESSPTQTRSTSSEPMTKDDEEDTPWTVITGENHVSTFELISQPDKHNRASPVAKSTDQCVDDAAVKAAARAGQALKARIRLGKLANWRSPVAIGAVKLTEAIEAVMAVLISEQKSSSKFSWNIPVRFGKVDEVIGVEIKWMNGAWRAPADKIEAILSLWLYSVQSRRKVEEEGGRSKQTMTDEDDSLTRAKESPEGAGLRVFGTNSHKEQLLRDLRWWTPEGIELPEALEIWPSAQSSSCSGGKTIEPVQCRVVGSGLGLSSDPERSQDPNKSVVYYGNPLRLGEPYSDDGYPYYLEAMDSLKRNHAVESTKSSNDIGPWLAIESLDSLQKLFVQDLFFAFLCAMAASGNAEFPTSETKIVPKKTSVTRKNLEQFALTNATLSKLARDVHGTGMYTLHEAWFSIISPLSLHEKLPIGDLLIQHARLAIEKFQEGRDFEGIVQVSCWLLDQAAAFSRHSYTQPRAVAMVLRQISEMRLAFSQYERYMIRWGHNDKFWLATLLRKLKIWKQQRSVHVVLQTQPHERLGMNTSLDFIHEIVEDEPTDFGIPKGCLRTLGELGKVGDDWLVWKFEKQPNFLDWSFSHYASTLSEEDARKFFWLYDPGDIHRPDLWGWTALHYACWRRKIYLIDALFHRKANMNIQGKDGSSPMHCAVRSGDEAVVEALISRSRFKHGRQYHPFRSNPDWLGRHPIHLAAIEGHVGIVELLKDSLDLVDAYGNTALHLAIVHQKTTLAEWLIENMTTETINRRDRSGSRSALEYAMGMFKIPKSPGIIRMLVERGADFSKGRESRLSEPMLNEAIRDGDYNLARLLLRKGARVDEKDSDDETALHRCAYFYNWDPDITTAVLNTDKSMNGKAITLEMRARVDKTPLHTAVENGPRNLSAYKDFLSRILEYNPEMNFDIKDSYRRTALDMAELMETKPGYYKSAKAGELSGPLLEQIERQKNARLRTEFVKRLGSLNSLP